MNSPYRHDLGLLPESSDNWSQHHAWPPPRLHLRQSAQLSSCCDKIQSQADDGRLGFGSQFKGTACHVRGAWGRRLRLSVTLRPHSERKEMDPGLIPPGSPARGMAAPRFKEDLPLMEPYRGCPQTHPEVCFCGDSQSIKLADKRWSSITVADRSRLCPSLLL